MFGSISSHVYPKGVVRECASRRARFSCAGWHWPGPPLGAHSVRCSPGRPGACRRFGPSGPPSAVHAMLKGCTSDEHKAATGASREHRMYIACTRREAGEGDLGRRRARPAALPRLAVCRPWFPSCFKVRVGSAWGGWAHCAGGPGLSSRSPSLQQIRFPPDVLTARPGFASSICPMYCITTPTQSAAKLLRYV
jgi:hypothetical protein